MKKISAIIYDCDGVMFDSHSANLAFYNRILEKFSYPLVTLADQEQAHLCHTASSPEVLKGLMVAEDVGPALEYASTVLDYREFIPLMIPELNLSEVLSELVKKYPLAVATNRGRSIDPVLKHFNLRDYFSVIVTSQDVKRPKPAPDMLLLAAEKLSVKTENCLFIGDSILDKQAAGAAAIPFVGYGSNVETDNCLSSHSELIPYLNCLH